MTRRKVKATKIAKGKRTPYKYAPGDNRWYDTGKRHHRRSFGERIADVYATPSRRTGARKGARTKVIQWRPGLYGLMPGGGHQEVLTKQVWYRGKLGKRQPHPRGGTHRPVLRAAGWRTLGGKKLAPGSIMRMRAR